MGLSLQLSAVVDKMFRNQFLFLYRPLITPGAVSGNGKQLNSSVYSSGIDHKSEHLSSLDEGGASPSADRNIWASGLFFDA